MIKKTTLLSDIVYNPKETDFLSSFTENKKIYGISMLIEQGHYLSKYGLVSNLLLIKN